MEACVTFDNASKSGEKFKDNIGLTPLVSKTPNTRSVQRSQLHTRFRIKRQRAYARARQLTMNEAYLRTSNNR